MGIVRCSKARDPDGEWWELQDDETGIPYYYNSKTGATEWDPPGKATVVPFHALLGSPMGKRLSMVVASQASVAFSDEQVDSLVRKASRASLRSIEGRVSRKNSIAIHQRKGSVSGVKSPSVLQAQVQLESGRRAGAGPAAAAALSEEERQIKRLSKQRHSQSETALETLKEAMNDRLRIDEEDGGDGGDGSDADSVRLRQAVARQGRRTTEVSFEVSTQGAGRMSEQIPRHGQGGRP
ncbi:hypothetical protein FBU59_004616, partial [Linderina macrospora]